MKETWQDNLSERDRMRMIRGETLVGFVVTLPTTPLPRHSWQFETYRIIHEAGEGLQRGVLLLNLDTGAVRWADGLNGGLAKIEAYNSWINLSKAWWHGS